MNLNFTFVTIVLLFASGVAARAVEPILWLDAGNAKTLTFGDEQVRSWKDANGKAVELVQPKVDHRPEPRGKLNGRSTLYFDGADFLAGPPVLAEGDDTFTMIALWRPKRTGVQAVFEQAGAGTGRRASLLQVGKAYGFNGQSNDAHQLVPVRTDKWHLTAMVITGTKKDNVIIIDNDSEAKTGSINIERQNVGIDGIRVGNKLTSNGEFFQGDLAEIRVFDSALSMSDLSVELEAVKKRWGLDFSSRVPEITSADTLEKESGIFGDLNLKPTAAQIEFFENKVRPVLADKCYRCHGDDEKKLKAGLHLNSLAGLLNGGDSGPAIVAGDPGASRIIQAIGYKDEDTAMPPKQKLKEAEIAALTKWVKMGAPWPGFDPAAFTLNKETRKDPYDWDLIRRDHWAFRPISNPKPPQVKNTSWPENDIDRFILARIETAGLTPNEVADKRTLIRRAYLDLIGLPPTPEQVNTFLKDDRPEAFASVVDELLESKHYGERWARHWLDVARYSDGLGGFGNGALLNAWRYRDWVVESLNEDMPYDEFVKQQIAGDVLKGDGNPVATGFFAVGPTYKSDGGVMEAILQAKAETLSDRVDTFSRAFLGLTVACARCHDHKFDPITTKDYYAIAGVFANSPAGEFPLAEAKEVTRYQEGQKKINEAKKARDVYKKDVRKAAGKEKRPLSAEENTHSKELDDALANVTKAAPAKYAFAHVILERGREDMHVALRGNLAKQGDLVPRRFLEIVEGKKAQAFTEGSGRRELAEAVVQPNNPLTARVMVNRVWQWHFGNALTRTPSNFGVLGEEPTHPLLLDWLSKSFVKKGWSLKQLHREIMLSSTWQMSSRQDAGKFSKDGDNRLIWRMNPRKLEVEIWRDSLLSVTGEIDLNMGGAPTEKIMESNRRSLYSTISRSGDKLSSDAFFRLFDFPSAQATSPGRATTTVPQQYLFMMNNSFMIDRAIALAKLLETSGGTEERIQAAYERLYGRLPGRQEVEAGMAFLDGHPEKWSQYAQVLLSAHEFLQLR